MKDEFIQALNDYAQACARKDWGLALAHVETAIDTCPTPVLYGWLSAIRHDCIQRIPSPAQKWARGLLGLKRPA